jgi:hypothetical protein
VQHELAIKRHPVLDDGGLELAVGYEIDCPQEGYRHP